MTGGLVEAVRQLRGTAAGTRLALQTADAAPVRRLRDDLVAQLDDYVIPRLEQQGAPLLMVVGGSTGAGKSTLVNTLVGRPVSAAGVLRPTTRSPVLVCHPSDLSWFTGERIFPGLPRVSGGFPSGADSVRGLQLVPAPSVPAGMALLDAPDIDSVVAANRELAAQLLAAADLWLFVTTAARYADAVPWDLLRSARDRSTALAVVLDRVPPEALGEVDEHLRRLLAAEGLADAPVLVVPETPLEAGMLPPAAVAAVRGWVDGLAADATARADVVRRTLAGALDSVAVRGASLASAVDGQCAAAEELAGMADAAYGRARSDLAHAVADGAMLRGEVLNRWQELLGTGELMRTLQSRIGRARDRVVGAVTGRPSAARPVELALEQNLEALVQDGLERAAADTAEQWQRRPDGAALLDPTLARADQAVVGAIPDQIRAWQRDVLALVSEEGADRRKVAKLASYGVNGAGSVLIVALFAHTSGLTGGEVAIAGGTAAVSQKVLEAVFGDQAVRTLATRAQEALTARLDELLGRDEARFRSRLAEVRPSDDAAAAIRSAVRAIETAR